MLKATDTRGRFNPGFLKPIGRDGMNDARYTRDPSGHGESGGDEGVLRLQSGAKFRREFQGPKISSTSGRSFPALVSVGLA